MKLIAILSAAALVATPIAAQVKSRSAKYFSDRLAGLTDVQRRGALRRAVLDSREKCVTVTRAAYQGTYKNLEMWVARCSSPDKAGANIDYGAFIGPDGTVQVSSCQYLVTVKWPACRKLD